MSDPDLQSIYDVLNSDHRAIAEQLAASPTAIGGEQGEADDAAREQLVMELVRHFVAEEQYLYPTVRDRIPNGAAIADDAFRSHRDVEADLRVLERQATTESEIDAVLATVGEQFDAHVRKQQDLFTKLAGTLSAAEAIELGEQVLGSEQVAPTRPRIVASESTGLNKAESFVEGFIDRVRDAYSHRGVDGSS
jgi:hypothetical protein